VEVVGGDIENWKTFRKSENHMTSQKSHLMRVSVSRRIWEDKPPDDLSAWETREAESRLSRMPSGCTKAAGMKAFID
jgi:hypothetical protein